MEGDNYKTAGGEDSPIFVDFYNLQLDNCLEIVPRRNKLNTGPMNNDE
jgi:hypothetical protein